MWGRQSFIAKKYGEGTKTDLDYGKLVIHWSYYTMQKYREVVNGFIYKG